MVHDRPGRRGPSPAGTGADVGGVLLLRLRRRGRFAGRLRPPRAAAGGRRRPGTGPRSWAPDRPLVLVRDHDVPLPGGRSLEVRTSGLWADHTCETPLEHWTVGVEAFARRPRRPPGGLRRASGATRARWASTWSGRRPRTAAPSPTGRATSRRAPSTARCWWARSGSRSTASAPGPTGGATGTGGRPPAEWAAGPRDRHRGLAHRRPRPSMAWRERWWPTPPSPSPGRRGRRRQPARPGPVPFRSDRRLGRVADPAVGRTDEGQTGVWPGPRNSSASRMASKAAPLAACHDQNDTPVAPFSSAVRMNRHSSSGGGTPLRPPSGPPS